MCLGVPGQLLKKTAGEPAFGSVAFGGVTREVCLAYTPEAEVGDFVIVHAGFSISVVDEAEARATLDILKALAPDAGEEDSGVYPGRA
jgi:hydrogenase expression/formation protein HypC